MSIFGIDVELINRIRLIVSDLLEWFVHRIIGRFKTIRLITGLERKILSDHNCAVACTETLTMPGKLT